MGDIEDDAERYVFDDPEDVDDLEALLARVEKAEGPDRELDTDIMAGLFPWAQRGSPYLAPRCIGDEHIYWHAPYPWHKQEVPIITASVDAVLGLIERELPGAHFRLAGPSRTYWASCGIPDEQKGDGIGSTPALALLAAFLRAKAAGRAALAEDGGAG